MPGKENRPIDRSLDLASLRRLVRAFDFEDAERFPTEMPRDWYRMLTVVSGRPGFPDFGKIELSDRISRDGKWSLQYALAGGSMSTAVTPGVIRVFPGSRYRVSCWMRTEGLEHAAVRMIARLFDRQGKPTGDEFATAPIRSEGEWTQVRIDLPEVSGQATDLSLELVLVQPSLLAASSSGHSDASERQPGDDITGFAWFDELEVWQIPSIRFGSPNAAQVFGANGSGELEIELRDLVSDELVGDIVISDIDGNVIHTAHLPLPGAGALVKVPLPPVEPGSYTALLTVTADGIVVAKRTVDLAILDQDRQNRSRGSMPRFGVNLPALSDADMPMVESVVRELDPDFAIVPAWPNDFDPSQNDARIATMRGFVDGLLDTRIEPVLAITSVPAALAAPRHLDQWQALHFFGDAESSGQAHVEPWLLAFGQHIERWQIGDLRGESAREPMDSNSALRLQALLEKRVAGPVLLTPIEADLDTSPAPPGVAHHVFVPWAARPATIADYLAAWKEEETILTLETAPSSIAERARIDDLALRAIHAWRSGVRSLAIDLAWNPGDVTESKPASLRSEAIAWRELGRSLSGRTFAGEVPMAEGVHGWLAGGPNPALIVWSDNEHGEPIQIEMLLSNSAVTTLDPFGRRSNISPSAGRHRIAVGATPLFIEGVDFALLQMLASARLEPSILESRRAPQATSIVITNTFGVAMSGTVAIMDQPSWEISPRGQTFSIPAGSEGRIPIRLGMPRSTTIGPAKLDVKLEWIAGENYVTTVPLQLTVDWPEVEVNSSWQFARSVDSGGIDVVVTVAVTNRGTTLLDLEAFAAARDYTQTRRPILKLAPGETALRVFQFPQGARRLSGGTVLAGVSEFEGERRHTSQLLLPPFLSRPRDQSTTGRTASAESAP
jgi:hypothetical protein